MIERAPARATAEALSGAVFSPFAAPAATSGAGLAEHGSQSHAPGYAFALAMATASIAAFGWLLNRWLQRRAGPWIHGIARAGSALGARPAGKRRRQ